MGKISVFAVELERELVSAGEVVKGMVVIELTEPLKMRAIHLDFLGYASLLFDEYIDRAGRTRRCDVNFSAREDYYKHTETLFGKPRGQIADDTVQELEVGRHEYPFEFVLPINIPASAEFKHGAIRHQLVVTIDKPWKTDHVLRKPFTVKPHLELIGQCATPISHTGEEKLGMSCCPSGSIIIEVQLPRTGYVPGEYIIFRGLLKNKSSRRVKCYIFRLRQRVTYHGNLPEALMPTMVSHHSSVIVGEIRREKGIEPFQNVLLEKEAFIVPPLPASEIEGCAIIECHYVLEIAMVQSTVENLCIQIPVKIGTVAPKGSDVVFSHEPYNPQWYNPDVPKEFPPPCTSDSASGDNPPQPSYFQAVGLKPVYDDDEVEDRGKIKHNVQPWGPSYSYYSLT